MLQIKTKTRKSRWFMNLVRAKYGDDVAVSNVGNKFYVYDKHDRTAGPIMTFDNMDDGIKRLINSKSRNYV